MSTANEILELERQLDEMQTQVAAYTAHLTPLARAASAQKMQLKEREKVRRRLAASAAALTSRWLCRR